MTAMMQIQYRESLNMNTKTSNANGISLAAAALLLVGSVSVSLAQGHLVDGITGSSFNLVAAPGYLSTPEGNSLYFWGYGTNGAQYSGPTLIVNQGDVVTVQLSNKLPVPASITFPGQSVVSVATLSGPTLNGLLTREAAPAGLNGLGGGVVSYQFTASEPGTYLYHSGTRPDMQIEMGMVGALIVRPTGFNPSAAATRRAYGDAASSFDHEYLFLLSDMDEKIHNTVELQVQAATGVPAAGLPISADMSKRFAVYWFINGRCGPDTMLPRLHQTLPAQPYDCFPLFHPGEQVLMRVIGGGSDEHPLHHHGNHARMIAQDGRLLQSPGGVGADLGSLEFTVPSTPGGTIDTIFSWTGAGLGWDPYGHKPGDPLAMNPAGVVVEDAADHGKPFPVRLPAEQHIVNGMMYGGSPFLGTPGILPPGEGGFNANNGFMYLWHSHAEKEIVNNDIFPGGMLTLALVEAWPSAPLPLGNSGAGNARSASTSSALNQPAVVSSSSTPPSQNRNAAGTPRAGGGRLAN
jgi:FtsP/CotA-like multicopper oxidase with cupredoxin domain